MTGLLVLLIVIAALFADVIAGTAADLYRRLKR